MITETNIQTACDPAVGSTRLLAWEVEIYDKRCIVFAATKAKARWIAVKGYWDAGYGRGRGDWPRAVAGRAERFDRSALRHKNAQPWTEEYVIG